MSEYLQGIDVSHYQGKIDWKAVKGSDVGFAFAKASQGQSVADSRFAENWAGMKAAGLLRGAYHFYSVGEDPKAQARNFLGKVKFEPGDLPPMVDIETENPGAESNAGQIADLHTFIAQIKAACGAEPFIYTGPSFWNAHFDDSFSDCPLWVAEYGVSAPKPVSGWSVWTIWQHSQSGTVPGISGHVDLDYFNGTSAQLDRFVLS